VHVSDSSETALAPCVAVATQLPAIITNLFPSLSTLLSHSTHFDTQRFVSCSTNKHADMPPLATPPEAPPVKAESPPVTAREMTLSVRTIKLEHGETVKGVVNVGMPLVAYSSPPPSLVDDSSGLLDKSDGSSQHGDTSSLRSEYSCIFDCYIGSHIKDQLELGTYEYAALEARYRALMTRHGELRKLSMAYHDVIQGSASYEDTDVDIDQLRTEAGREGLRAKALEADVLRPIVRDAGGPQALVSQTQSVQELLERVGGMQELNEMVLDAQMLRLRVDDVGGLHGLENLTRRSDLLDSEQQEHSELKAQVLGKDGLRDKARKYDELQQAFAAIDRGNVRGNVVARTSIEYAGPRAQRSVIHPTRPVSTRTHVSKSITQAPRNASSGVAVGMNPDRARLLTSTPPRSDPNRDLYEPAPLVRDSPRKTGSNDIPLGRPRDGKPSSGQGPQNVATGTKRKYEQNPQGVGAKRPRVDVGRASAVLQASLAGTSTDPAFFPFNTDRSHGTAAHLSIENGKEHDQRPGRNYGVEHTFKNRLDGSRHEVIKREGNHGNEIELLRPAPLRNDRSSIDSLLGTGNRLREPVVVKKEDMSDDPQAARVSDLQSAQFLDSLAAAPSDIPAAGANDQGSTKMMIGGYPIALCIGGSNPTSKNPTDLIKPNDVPLGLASFLSGEIKKYTTNIDFKLWNDFPPNSNTCILRYLVDGHRPSGQPQERRACRSCSSAWVRHHRPCALLQEVDGVHMVVFMPLRNALRGGIPWTEKRYWVMGAPI
jgi:hypothetical protein